MKSAILIISLTLLSGCSNSEKAKTIKVLIDACEGITTFEVKIYPIALFNSVTVRCEQDKK